MLINFKKGFTLSEVLITLAIIGVVAALTIPSIIKYFENIQYASAWKKAYSVLEQVTSRMIEDNGGSLKNAFADSSDARNLVGGYLSYIKTCDTNAILGNCWYSGYAKRFDNGQLYTAGADTAWWGIGSSYAAILKDGMTIYFQIARPNCDASTECLRIFIDTNGLKAPNTMGKDIFYVFFYANKLNPNPWNGNPYYGGDGGGMGGWLLSN